MMKKMHILLISLLLITFVIFSCGKQEPTAPELTQNQEVATLAKEGHIPLGDMSDAELLAWMQEINDQLAAEGSNIRIGQIEFFTVGVGRPDDNDPRGRIVRILQQPFRWVANDPFRNPQGDDITYIVAQTRGATPSGLTNAETEAILPSSSNASGTYGRALAAPSEGSIST